MIMSVLLINAAYYFILTHFTALFMYVFKACNVSLSSFIVIIFDVNTF